MEKTEALLVKVNYRKTLSQTIAAIAYQRVNKNIKNFRKQKPHGLIKNKEQIAVVLFNFGQTIFYSYDQIIGAMRKDACRPATFMELLAFCHQFKTAKSILALGSIHHDNGPYVPCSSRGDEELMYFYVGDSPAIYSPWYFMGVKINEQD